jgi:hypothetical protein
LLSQTQHPGREQFPIDLLQHEKSKDPTISELIGSRIDLSVNHEFDPNEMDQVICNRKNIMIQEFQYCSESQLIEVMILKTHPIQFALIVNVI